MHYIIDALGIVASSFVALIFIYALTKVATKAVLQARREFEQSQTKE